MPARKPPRWIVTDDDGRVLTIEVVAGSLVLSPDPSGRFRTTNPEVAQDLRAKLGAAMGQMHADRGDSWPSS